LPETRNTNLQVMETDGFENVSWAEKKNNSSSSLVRVNRSGNENFAASWGICKKISFDSEVFDTNGEFNLITNYRFTDA
jgi:hypothetical protein